MSYLLVSRIFLSADSKSRKMKFSSPPLPFKGITLQGEVGMRMNFKIMSYFWCSRNHLIGTKDRRSYKTLEKKNQNWHSLAKYWPLEKEDLPNWLWPLPKYLLLLYKSKKGGHALLPLGSFEKTFDLTSKNIVPMGSNS